MISWYKERQRPWLNLVWIELFYGWFHSGHEWPGLCIEDRTRQQVEFYMASTQLTQVHCQPINWQPLSKPKPFCWNEKLKVKTTRNVELFFFYSIVVCSIRQSNNIKSIELLTQWWRREQTTLDYWGKTVSVYHQTISNRHYNLSFFPHPRLWEDQQQWSTCDRTLHKILLKFGAPSKTGRSLFSLERVWGAREVGTDWS